MSRRLGEILVEAKKITEAQLHRALTAQLVFGGHLGTSLLELGYIDEESLGEAIAEATGTPYANFDIISRVPYAVIRSIPARLVEKHKVVPLRVEGKTLQMAMIDPRNLLALDEISFVTGYRIEPWVAPEVRVLQVLETYYNIPRTQRFSALARELSRLTSRRERLRPLESRATAQLAEASPMTSKGAFQTAAVGGGRPAAPAPPAAQAASTPAPGAPPPADPVLEHFEKYGYGRSWREVAESLDMDAPHDDVSPEEVDTRPQRKVSAAPQPASEAAPAAMSLKEASRRLAAAGSVEEVVSTVLGYASTRLGRTIFFVTKGDIAQGWAGRGAGVTEASIRNLAIPVPAPNRESIFSVVPEGRTHYLGPVPVSASTAGFFAKAGFPAPRSILIVPLRVKERVAGWLYADDGGNKITTPDIPSIHTLCSRAGLALQILILRNKILTT
jgi:hypothetical protein